MSVNKIESTETQTIHLEKIASFLSEIGIEYYFSDAEYDSFLRGIKIENGKLNINPKNLLCVGDILHEAGHLACIPASFRSKVNDGISKSIGEEYTYEMGTIAWSVAAAIHLKIPLSGIFHEEGYKGEADWLIEQYSSLYWPSFIAMDGNGRF